MSKEFYSAKRYRKSIEKAQCMKSYKERNEIIRSHAFGKMLELGCGEFPLFKDSIKGDIAKIKGCLRVDCNKKMVFDNNLFDTIIATELIEHLYNPKTFLRECYRILKPDGVLILSTPNAAYWKIRLNMMLGNLEWLDMARESGHLVFFTPKTLKKFVEDSGFKNIILKHIGRTKMMSLCGGFVCIGKKYG